MWILTWQPKHQLLVHNSRTLFLIHIFRLYCQGLLQIFCNRRKCDRKLPWFWEKLHPQTSSWRFSRWLSHASTRHEGAAMKYKQHLLFIQPLLIIWQGSIRLILNVFFISLFFFYIYTYVITSEIPLINRWEIWFPGNGHQAKRVDAATWSFTSRILADDMGWRNRFTEVMLIFVLMVELFGQVSTPISLENVLNNVCDLNCK